MGKIINIIKVYSGNIDWRVIRRLLKALVGNKYVIKETCEEVKIDNKFVKEFTCSKYTQGLNKSLKKIKANISLYIKDILENCGHADYEVNKKDKHIIDAMNGWQKYTARFAIEQNIDGTKEKELKYYSCIVIIRCTNKELYLYDIINIKKEANKSHDGNS